MEASFGLGEALVSGLVNADVYRVRDGQVIERVIATKQRAIYAIPTGGTQEQAISPELQDKMIDAFFHIIEKDVRGLTQDLINLQFLAPTIDPQTIRPVVEKLFSDYLNLKLGDIRFKELTYELAEVMYAYPFRIPAQFTYIIKAIMTLEGVGITLDPNFSFFEVAKPFAKEFMLKREGRFFRDQIVKRLLYGEQGEIQWGKMWKLTKMAAKMFWDALPGKTPPPPSLLNGAR